MSTFNKDLKISNAKGVLIFLVVFGHLIEIYKKDYYELFVFIYAFHMPLFIFISGYLAKRMRLSKIINMILLYLIFQTLFNWILYMTGDYTNLQFTYGRPHFHLWYIVSLGVWYSIALLINGMKLKTIGNWVVFVLLFIISFISRWYTNDVADIITEEYSNFTSYTLSYQRTLSFTPFFFAGFFMSKKWLSTLYNSLIHPIVALVIFSTVMFVTVLYTQESFGIESMFRGSFGSHRYLEDNDGIIVYSFKISIHYLLAFGLSYVVFNFISNKENILTKWGDHSLQIFLFHPIFVFVIRQTEFMDNWTPSTKLAAFFMASLLIVMLLGSKTFVRMTNFLCNPYNTLVKISRSVRDIRNGYYRWNSYKRY